MCSTPSPKCFLINLNDDLHMQLNLVLHELNCRQYFGFRRLFESVIDQTVDSIYINENDDFVIEFSNGSLIEVFSEDGDLGMYYEFGETNEPTLQ